MPRWNSLQACSVEPLHQGRDGIPRCSSREEGSFLIGVSVGYIEKLFGSGYTAGRFLLGTTATF
jgi:hypothetical protein